eukprot:Lankesteria_metandrocarpae@DN3502_c0_g1_i1.p1
MDISSNRCVGIPELNAVEVELETLLVSLQGVSLHDHKDSDDYPSRDDDHENNNVVNVTPHAAAIPTGVKNVDKSTNDENISSTVPHDELSTGSISNLTKAQKEHSLAKYKLKSKSSSKAVDVPPVVAVDNATRNVPHYAEVNNFADVRSPPANTAPTAPPPPPPPLTEARQPATLNNHSEPATGDPLSIETILLKAALVGREDVVQACLHERAALSYRDNSGWTALHHAAGGGSIAVVKLIVAALKSTKQEDLLNERCPKGWVPVHIAVCRDFLEVTKYLLDAGADISIPLKHNSPPCRAELTESELIHFAAVRGHIPILCALLQRGCVVECLDAHNRTPLHYAAYRPRPEVVRFLLDCGASADNIDSHGRTPFHAAALGGDMEICKLLMATSAVRERKDIWDLTPSKLASTSAVSEVLRGGAVAADESASWSRTSLRYCGVYDELTPFERTVASAIISGLKEPKEAQVARAVKRLGVERCVCAFDAAMKVQNSGGVKRKDGGGNRRPGGVFFYSLQEELRMETAAAGSQWKRMSDWGYITMEDDEKKKSLSLRQRKRRREELRINALGDGTDLGQQSPTGAVNDETVSTGMISTGAGQNMMYGNGAAAQEYYYPPKYDDEYYHFR